MCNYEDRVFIAKQVMCTYRSLVRAMQNAHGSADVDVDKMTLEEFIIKIAAPNNIRFVFANQVKEKNETK